MSEQPVDIRVELNNMLSVVDGSITMTREQMEAIGDNLQPLWGKAHDAGDEESVAMITDIWNRANALVEANASLAFQVVATGNIAAAAIQESKAYQERLGELEDAIDAVDEDHPGLRDYAESIRESAREDYQDFMQEDVWPEAMAEAYEEIRDEVNNKIENLAGCGWKAASAFLSIIMGRRAQFTPLQSEMFTELLLTFVAQIESEEAANGH